jgi:hypothetical protein
VEERVRWVTLASNAACFFDKRRGAGLDRHLSHADRTSMGMTSAPSQRAQAPARPRLANRVVQELGRPSHTSQPGRERRFTSSASLFLCLDCAAVACAVVVIYSSFMRSNSIYFST